VNAALGCYTAVRARDGRVWHLERHVARLARDAERLGLGPLDREAVRAELVALAAASRDDGRDRKLRLAVEPGADGAAKFAGSAASLEDDAAAWRAITALHPGASLLSAVKTTDRAPFEAALAAARAAGADEALLCDAAGFLVEGARTSVVAVLADGSLVTPPLARGAQAGVARAIALESIAELAERDLARARITTARELVALNAVRGARAIVALDGAPIGGGRPGPWAERLGRLLEAG
jgi:branched-subunit amino acid aminotransferase/4-amino-4-deoxychorismate lyase